MLFGEIMAAYCEDHTEHTDSLGGLIAGFGMLKQEKYE
jgi:hypothetical protein